MLASDKWQRVTIVVDTEKGKMTTYVGAELCATIENDKIKLKDGRFAVPSAALLLFASRNPARAPGLQVRYIDVSPVASPSRLLCVR